MLFHKHAGFFELGGEPMEKSINGGAGEVFQWNPNSKQYWLNSDFHLSLSLLIIDSWVIIDWQPLIGNHWLRNKFSRLNFVRFTTHPMSWIFQSSPTSSYTPTKWPSSKQASPGGQGLQVWHQRPLNFHHRRPEDPRNRSQRGPWSGYKFPPFRFLWLKSPLQLESPNFSKSFSKHQGKKTKMKNNNIEGFPNPS